MSGVTRPPKLKQLKRFAPDLDIRLTQISASMLVSAPRGIQPF